jgi:hypothetical protein
VNVESNADPPHNRRQRHNNPISVPSRNASGINKHLILENCVFTWNPARGRTRTCEEQSIAKR